MGEHDAFVDIETIIGMVYGFMKALPEEALIHDSSAFSAQPVDSAYRGSVGVGLIRRICNDDSDRFKYHC